ncbi:MAG: folylpolyglutamate synthase/dihydrofolate synthase family protein [Methylophilaceae bacterium]
MKEKLNLLLRSLETRHSNPIDLSLKRVKEFKQKLTLKPKFKIITVAGTNGKGSVCFYINQILKHTNYKIGLYTSPHFFDFNERIVINNEKCSESEILKSLEYILGFENSDTLTFFEITTLVAILIFDNHNIDIAILEVGLGGRLDAVNAFEPDISVITSIGLDHTEFLGETLEKIAVEKSGVMRATKPCVIGEEDCIDILKKQASDINSIPYFFNKDFDSSVIPFDKSNLTYVQQKNLSCAIFSLQKLGLTEPTSNLKEELLQQNFFGRFNRISTTPEVIIDVAHNLDSVQNLVQSLIKLGNKKTYFVFSILKDKDLSLIIQLFEKFPYQSEWLVSELNNPRAQKLSFIEQNLEKNNFNFESSDSIKKAYELALNKAANNDRIVVFGSFYVISEIFEGNYAE